MDELGWAYEFLEESESCPDCSDLTFGDIVYEFKLMGHPLAERKLYAHQFKTYYNLLNGKNVILISGTGSGKTEAWALYALRHCVKTLVIYPNLALANDQFRRLNEYVYLLGRIVIKLEASNEEAVKEYLEKNVVDIVVTNPAYLTSRVKRGGGPLKNFLRSLDLIVLDELSFYTSSRATLLMKVVELVVKYLAQKRPQIVVLTATLGNSDELASFLTELNNRETVIIQGKPFRVRNHLVLVLGRRDAMEKLQRNLRLEAKLDPRLSSLEDKHLFELIEWLSFILDPDTYYKVVPGNLFDIDVSEYLAKLALQDEGLTIVFTDTINTAEILARKVRTKLPESARNLIKTHHSLLSNIEREEIERQAREGKIRVLISPRTLEQGIDIGNVVRVVHYGLPAEVRQFLQREGRKGRRPDIPFTESIIIPVRDSDRRILRRGIESLKEWIGLGHESIIVNMQSKHVKLFEALFKLFRGLTLSREELDLLRSLDLVEIYPTLRPKKRALQVWRNFQFYGYGVDEYARVIDGNALPETISRRELVEKFQQGCIDLVHDAIVIQLNSNPYRTIIETQLVNIWSKLDKIPWLKDAVGRYYARKRAWDEEPNIVRDVAMGRLASEVVLDVHVPEGFGELRERPLGVVWIVESEKPQPCTIGEITIYRRAKVAIPLDVKCEGTYTDFTYGYTITLPRDYKPEYVRLALALLVATLRLYRGVSIRELEYQILCKEDVIIVKLWEVEAIGLFETIPLSTMSYYVRKLSIDNKLLQLLSQIDEEAYFTVLVEGEQAVENARKLLLHTLLPQLYSR